MSNMFYNASRYSFERAKQLRKAPTSIEEILWDYLRKRPFGYKFRRQHPIGKFVVDFFCFKLKLVIEADGEIHDDELQKKHDQTRQKQLESLGLHVLRVTEKDIVANFEGVTEIINRCIKDRAKLSEASVDTVPPSGGQGAGV